MMRPPEPSVSPARARCLVVLALVPLCSLPACRRARSASSSSPGPTPGAVLLARPARVFAPPGLRGPAPLVVLLHGYGDRGASMGGYLGLAALAQERGFFYVAPDGTPDRRGQRFWDAGPACCNFFGEPVDDIAYLDALLDAALAEHPGIDPRRVYLVGVSNGGFLASRYACERAARVAALVNLAGSEDADATRCRPAAPVSVLLIHADHDRIVRYEGGSLGALAPFAPRPPAPYAGARAAFAAWAERDGCAPAPVFAPNRLDLDLAVPGPETDDERRRGCRADAEVALWTNHGGGHMPAPSPSLGALLWGFLSPHRSVPPATGRP